MAGRHLVSFDEEGTSGLLAHDDNIIKATANNII